MALQVKLLTTWTQYRRTFRWHLSLLCLHVLGESQNRSLHSALIWCRSQRSPYWVVDLTRLISREVVPQPLCLWEVLLDSSSQMSHMFWACRVLNTKRIGTMLWTGTCVYSPKVMVILPCHWDLTLVTACQWYVDMVEGCNSFGEFLFLKGRLCGIWNLWLRKATPFTDGAKGFNLKYLFFHVRCCCRSQRRSCWSRVRAREPSWLPAAHHAALWIQRLERFTSSSTVLCQWASSKGDKIGFLGTSHAEGVAEARGLEKQIWSTGMVCSVVQKQRGTICQDAGVSQI